ncbi:MAG TPA: Maf family nucleotide pyrophosphatase [Bacteroidia bacterium]|nr:Maf family nucleotide pyrophosphatase [Bacteroidia bacterium]
MIQAPPVILASGSPRRQELLAAMGIIFSVVLKEVDETFPEHLRREEVALYLAEKKSASYKTEAAEGNLVITADTIVCLEEQIIGKPEGFEEGFEMLKLLSGKRHEVITGVTLRTNDTTVSFFDTTNVYFKPLTSKEITFYLKTCSPYDKAGSYGIQDWIGYIGVEKIEGSYQNVMGLPVQKLYAELIKLHFEWQP